MKEVLRQRSTDGTVKVLFELHDGARVESVLLHRQRKQAKPATDSLFTDRATLCLSSQVGCSMGCSFCLTGKQGLTRNLTTAEILGQVEALEKEFPITNLVFMGMGEPLQNFDAVTETIRTLLSRPHRPFSKRKILVSTSGWVPAIDRLAQTTPVRLAISLSAPTDALRTPIMPINRKWGVDELLDAGERYARASKMKVMLEYVLLEGVNDHAEHAEELYRKIQGRPFQVNLIPLNEFKESAYRRPGFDSVKRFQHALVSRGVTATWRSSGGPDILAACGQLAEVGALTDL
jgi:23S rRNA (adenine2503-C2)-methyltransferase